MKLERVIYCGDNLEWMRQFPDEFVDLCYIDPPFFSNKYYEVIFHDGEEIRAFEDRWKGGIEHYIEWMRERIFEIHRVLKSTGSMYLHCDPTAGHYLKVLMDGVFGLGNFRNEIVWKRTHAHSSSRRYGPVHDIILFYSKSDDFTWTDPKGPYDLEYIQEHFTHVDPATGRQFQPITLTGSGVRHGESGKPWRGIDPSKSGSGRRWALPRAILDRLGIEGGTIQDKLDALDAAGMI
ncbi:MAG: DNA-methyltransferase, partial [Anaerolineae bacterium]